MAFKLTQSKEQIEGKEVAPEGIYTLKLVGFKPKFSKPNPQFPDKAPSLNLNAKMEIIDNPEQEGKFVYEVLNMNSFMFPDFCHAFGLPMETDGESYWLPGTWDSASDFDPANADTYKYDGPLVGRTAQAEVAVDSYNGRQNNKVRRYFCAVDDCANKFPEIRHSENLLRKNS
jgi:hypothetical protein